MLNHLRAFLFASLALVSSAAFAQRNLLIPAEPMVTRNYVGLSKWVGGIVYLSRGGIMVNETLQKQLSTDIALKREFKADIEDPCFKNYHWYNSCFQRYRKLVYYEKSLMYYGDYSDVVYRNMYLPKHTDSLSEATKSFPKFELGGSSASERGYISKPFVADGCL